MTIAEIGYDLRDPQQREQLFEQLYEEVFPVVAEIVSKQGGSFHDARDVFQDALIIYYEKKLSGELQVKLSDEGYIVGIAKHLLIKKFSSRYKYLPLDYLEKKISLSQHCFETETKESNRLLQLLEVAGKKCLELLRAIYYDKLSMHEVSDLYGFSNPHSASVQKYKCIGKIKVIVEQKSLNYEDFME